ncbi:hypothetical protein D3C87_1636900 [compost metagenome]
MLFAKQQAEVWTGTADLAGANVSRVGIGNFRVVGNVPRHHVRLLRTTGLDMVSRHQWQCQIDRRISCVRRYIQGQRTGTAIHFEETAVRQDSRGTVEHQFAHVEVLQIDFQTQETPGVTAQ